jgi:hypothetical protein
MAVILYVLSARLFVLFVILAAADPYELSVVFVVFAITRKLFLFVVFRVLQLVSNGGFVVL